MNPKDECPLFKNSTFSKLDLAELLEHAKQSPFGHGTETVTDLSVRNSFEIDASEFSPEQVENFARNYMCEFRKLCLSTNLELRPVQAGYLQ